MSAKTVFISYSHKDKDLLGPMVAQLKALEQAGLLEVWTDTRIDAGDTWYPEIEEAMKGAAVAVCLVSEYFLASNFCMKQEVPFLLKRSADEGLLIVPVLLSDCLWEAHRWLKDTQMLPGEGQSVRTHFPQNPAAVFVRAAKRIYDKLNDPGYQPPAPAPAWPPLAPDRIDVARLPETGAKLFGREREITLLNQTWASAEKIGSVRTHVLAFTAHGGVGKSTLVNHWLDEMKRDHFRGATRVFGWSFYSQGVRQQGPASADTFVAAALRFFGDEAMAASPASAWDKGERLARLVGAERALLVLDGMEPLQSAQIFDRGKLRDPALESLLRGLAKQSAGLCLITTRESLLDLAKKPGFVERDLEQITPQDGRALLRTARVAGTDAELESLAQQFGPHALAISLLGVYLHEQPGHGVGPAQKLEQMPGEKPVDRVLAGFEQWLGASAEREVLHLLGLFDRPADAGCLKALRAQPAIAGLTDRMAGLGDAEWECVLTRLEKLQLIHTRQNDSGPRFLDAHPLTREHFAKQLREKNSEAWRAAHRRLYEHLCAITPENPERTLEYLQPLYQAVVHGCQSGEFETALRDVLVPRIFRYELGGTGRFFAADLLGLWSLTLSTLSGLFLPEWKPQPVQWRDKRIEALLYSTTSMGLRTHCRFREALEVGEIGYELMVNASPGEAVRIARVNNQTCIASGDLKEALDCAEKSQAILEKQPDLVGKEPEQIVDLLARHGETFHHMGKFREARAKFEEAEKVNGAMLTRFSSYEYCDFLLTLAEQDFVTRRFDEGRQELHNIEQRVDRIVVPTENHPLREALRLLIKVRAAMLRVRYGDAPTGADEVRKQARRDFDDPAKGIIVLLEKAGQRQHRPLGLLAYANLLCDMAGYAGISKEQKGELIEKADCVLKDAREIAAPAWEDDSKSRCNDCMKLHLVDYHLARAQWFVLTGKLVKASQQKDEARDLIETTGYERRRMALT